MNAYIAERPVGDSLGQEERRVQAILHGELPDEDPVEKIVHPPHAAQPSLARDLPLQSAAATPVEHPVLGAGPVGESEPEGLPARESFPREPDLRHRGAKRRRGA